MKCIICGKDIKNTEKYVHMGKNKEGEDLVRHDDKKHREQVIKNFFRSLHTGEQIG